MDVWPVLPLVIRCACDYPITLGRDNILAALKRSGRICRINIEPKEGSPLEKVLAVMQVPFPGLTLMSHYIRKTVLPDSFLNASSLQTLYLDAISFPGLPKRLLSATHLVKLWFLQIPHPGHISPEVMVTCLSTCTLTNLELLYLGFNSFPIPARQENQPRHLSKRSVLLALTDFTFRGISSYLKAFMAHIDSPKLNKFSIDFSPQFDPDTPQLDHFISRTPSLQAPENVTYLSFRSRFHHGIPSRGSSA
jgi:hypothetical protein